MIRAQHGIQGQGEAPIPAGDRQATRRERRDRVSGPASCAWIGLPPLRNETIHRSSTPIMRSASARMVGFACLVAALTTLLSPPTAHGQRFSDRIRLNQVGFYPGAPKRAIALSAGPGRFYVTTPDLTDTAFVGTLSPLLDTGSFPAGFRIADFSALQRSGTFVVWIPSLGYSHKFAVRPRVHAELSRAALAGFYLQRASTPISVHHAGDWSRPAGHTDDSVRVHPSAATPRRPAGTVIASPGGWYDAADYNKYIVNSAITVATLLALYEDFHASLAPLETGIPESGNALPDLLDEALWNLRWMLTMQDPDDGGVYHKLTEARFSDMVMPAEVRSPRYVVQKSTQAALDFAAVMAQASRVFRRFNGAVPGLADSTLSAALHAWRWARTHPDSIYDQQRLNERFDPDIETGEYADRHLADERIWAAAELYATTRQDSFVVRIPLLRDHTALVPFWGGVRALGYQSLLRFRGGLWLPAGEMLEMERMVVETADSLVQAARVHPYGTPIGARRDFVWGSNAVAANQGMTLVQAYRLTGDAVYLRAALANLDYLLGRNPTGYSFVTGFGDRAPLYPHHRPSVADGVVPPVPGWLVGGPNAGLEDPDWCEPPAHPADETYVDRDCSYASNEVAINWNAPLVYLTVALEALQYEIGRTGAVP